MTENDYTEISVSIDLQTKNEGKSLHKDALHSKNHVLNMMFQSSMILAEEVKLQLQQIQINRKIINFKDQRLDLLLHNERNLSIDRDQSDLINLGPSIQIGQRWILPNKNLNLDHIEVWENQMEEQKIDKPKKLL